MEMIGILIIFVGLLYGLVLMQQKHISYTKRTFAGLGLGILFGGSLQLIFGTEHEALKGAIEWINVVGGGYVRFLQLLVVPLIFISLVQAFTKIKENANIARIATNVLGTLMITVMIASAIGLVVALFYNLDGAQFTRGAEESARILDLQERQTEVANLAMSEQVLNFIPSNIFEDFANLRPTSTIAVVIFSSLVGVAYLGVARKEPEQAEIFKQIIDAFHAIVMRIVTLVLRMAPFGILALMTRMTATSSLQALINMGTFLIANYTAILLMFAVHMLILILHGLNPRQYLQKVWTVLSFAFTSRSSAGSLPMNVSTQTDALGVDSTTANFSGTFGLSIGQNGCGGIYPTMLVAIVAPAVGMDLSSPATWATIILTVAISSFGVAGVGGGATFASLIVFSTLGLPIEIIGLMISIEPIIDMGRTALNVNGSMIAGVTSSKRLNLLDQSIYQDSNQQFVSESSH